MKLFLLKFVLLSVDPLKLHFSLAGRLDRITYILEVASQLVGAFVGSILLRISLPGNDLTHPLVAMGGVSTGHPLSTFIWCDIVKLSVAKCCSDLHL